MTTRDERTRALLYAHDFMASLVSGQYKRVPKEVREHARRVLRHYPTAPELLITAEAEERDSEGKGPLGCPMLSAPVLEKELEASRERYRAFVQQNVAHMNASTDSPN